MFKEIFKLEEVTALNGISLLIFFAVFVMIGLWIYTRPKRDVQHWSQLPLGEGSNSDDEKERSR